MNVCKEYDSLIIDVASGATGEGDRSRLEEHLVTCDACSAAFKNLTRTVELSSLKNDPGEVFWDGYYGRLAERMEIEDNSSASRFQPLTLVKSSLLSTLPKWSLQVAAAMVLIVSGIVIGRSTQTNGVLAEQTASSDVQHAELQNRAYSYLDRSKTLLLGVVNFDVDQDDPGTLNIERRRTMAGSLIQEASLLRSELTAADERRLSELISDLEIILLQIANIESNYDIPEIEMVQNGVDRKSIMFKIDVESMSRFDSSNSSPDELRRRPTSGAASSAV